MSEHPSLFDTLTSVERVLQPSAGKVHAHPRPTERAAAEKVSIRSGSQKARLLVLLAERGEDTPHELFAEAHCAYPHVATSRLSEMAAPEMDPPLVEVTDRTKATPWGGESRIFRILPAGRAVAAELRERMAA